MSNLTMDLTGSLENFAESNRIFRIFKYGQQIDFGTTVFADSVKVYYVSGGVSGVELTKGVDYLITEENISSCDNDMSRCKIQDGSFTAQLISGIEMIRGVEDGTTYTVAISYQRLYPNQVRTAYLHNEPLNVTPELLYDLITKVEQHDSLLNRVTDSSTVTSGSSVILEVDEDCSNPNNIITDEEHFVSTSNNQFLIHPKGGSFYYDSVVITHPSSGETLKLGTDYAIVGMDEAATKASTYTSPVYRFILIKTSINDTIKVTYHAFGGSPTIDNYRQLLTNLNNVISYLNDANTLTESNLGSSEVLTSLYERINTLETQMRRLQGTPSYGDVTSGKCTLMKIFSETAGLHWYTIASLYTITGGTSPCTADTFVFRLQSQLSHFQFQCAVSVDLSNQKGDRFNVNIISDNYPRGYTPFTDYGSIDKIIRPQLRVVWDDQDTASGAYLQLGFELTNMMEETLAIMDLSGQDSCWKLVDEVSTVTTPKDSDFLLPDGTSTWSTSLSKSLQESMLVPFHQGHLIWAGTQAMNRPNDGWQYFQISDDLLIDSSVDITRIKRLRVDVEEVNGLQFPVDINFNAGTDHLKGHAAFTHQEQPVYINAEIYYEDNKPVCRLNYDVIAGTESNELDIRDLVIFL